jgi:hypothetical protein
MIIGISGYAQAGKDTAGDCLVEHYGFTRIALADPVRNLVYDTHPDIAATVDAVGWETAKTLYPNIREALITVGVGARTHIGPNVWLDAMKARMKHGEMWRVTRTDTGPANTGVSENTLTSFEFDRHLDNFGTIADLHENVTHEMFQLSLDQYACEYNDLVGHNDD